MGIGFLLFGLVAVRLVYRGLLWGIVAACALLAAPAIVRWAKAAPALLRTAPWRNAWTLAAALYFLIAVALTSLPATMNDEMIYHLAVPKTLLATHGGFPFHDNIYAFFPQLGEMFFLLGLGTAGEAAAKLFHVAAGFLLFLAVHRFALGLTDRKHARLAAAAFLTVPSVMAILSLAYVDLTFALFTFLAVISIREYFEGRNLGHALLAGLMLGGAVSVKYTGLQMTALVLCLLAITRLKAARPPCRAPGRAHRRRGRALRSPLARAQPPRHRLADVPLPPPLLLPQAGIQLGPGQGGALPEVPSVVRRLPGRRDPGGHAPRSVSGLHPGTFRQCPLL